MTVADRRRRYSLLGGLYVAVSLALYFSTIIAFNAFNRTDLAAFKDRDAYVQQEKSHAQLESWILTLELFGTAAGAVLFSLAARESGRP